MISSNSFYTSTGALTPDNWVISHAIDLRSFNKGDDIELSWKVRGELSGFSHEYYTINAATNNQISSFQSSPVKRSEYVDEVGGAGVFVTRTLDISSLAGNFAYIAFRHHNSTNQYNINIDEVSVVNNALLGADDFQIDSFKHYYNRNSDILTLKSSNSSFNSVKIFNILGQQTINEKLNQSEENINLSNLIDGIYIAKVEIDNTFQTIKFMKY